MSECKQSKSDLFLHWMIVGIMIAFLVAYNILCHIKGTEIQIGMDEEQRVFIRTLLYILAIFLFPLVKLLRYILLRLNQTMLGNYPAKNRYLVTITVTMTLIETVGAFGFIMFILGDKFNTLYIFSTLAALGIFLHAPKQEEYKQIIEALRLQNKTESVDL